MGNDALKIKRKRNIFINVCVFINTFIRFFKVPHEKKNKKIKMYFLAESTI